VEIFGSEIEFIPGYLTGSGYLQICPTRNEGANGRRFGGGYFALPELRR
jgi:hypothetical protein